jgi:hypothetical protein
MAIVVASSDLSDDEFLAAFANCTLPPSSFRRGDHLRLAWLLLHRKSFDEALTLIREGIKRYAAHQGAAQLYHETVTIAWVQLLATHDEPTFEVFLAINAQRLNINLLHQFWTPAVLESEAAKRDWMQPDRTPLPFRH